ncbi:AP-4 complex accessory subunit RUSC2 isoform X1 [Dasypus novemcinctus]|uniref:AP-4 complex accessory subunit RUSC2 isoform X1 n=3 Tax=Dasypus novemcinctus TaxID=9361 RepID=UPI00265F9C29|nr:AP-4 complex accessory subunit RUSC2 isoform X1 [Dasypus novemcinctus]XP_004457398.2 AP-4 complex accessory subunit RUSC2 isoform X1 [Dasypus novemcinctus]XP_058158027.1 AP-4 complex accessory subunit RUSC2 isoform X1 [Dasypus novemcinctus]XP_058158028.1 AP-4 complex accessory subunit RUSC2 isoform X1 [Dasypus novemcinctus]XP_058158029.1 AP-4 complex accessory subunit RUSC2 isoform X1 [Dasypus novemcinctus]XP_058158030.1 AP-4 complex accessory subunit RUSC2 isoform X1 [Dasypus novemcinctus]
MPLFELSRMDSPPKLTGETLIVHHIPLVHCQVPDRQCCGGASGGGGSTRPNPFCPPELGITQPDQDLGQADSLLYNSLHSAPGGSTQSADSTKSRGRDGRGLGAPKRHNPFLLQEGVGEPGLGDLYEDGIGDRATQQSFHLHGAGQPTFHLSSFQLPPPGQGVGRPWGATRSRAGVVEGQEQEPVVTLDTRQGSTSHCCQPELEAETMELDECGGPGGSGSGGGASDTSGFSFDQEWKLSSDESPRNPGCSGSGPQHCRCSSTSSQSEAADQSMGYVSDSSCNSSDGVLVTFSTLYNKMHGNSRANLNSALQSCSDSSFCSHSDPGAFYLDLQPSPAESKMSCESHHPDSGGKEGGYGCPHASSPELDANCNSYRPHCEPCPAVADLTACFQSQARLVVATQNYYKLVTCDLSSQSSPSPAGSSITSCSEEHTKISPTPGRGPDPGPSQPSEYYLFQKPEVQPGEQEAVGSAEAAVSVGSSVIEGQVYTNTSPPNLSTGRQRSRSYDRSLERSPPVRLGSLERMLSCPVRLSEGPAGLAGPSSPPRRVTSFAELAKGRKKAPGSGSPPLRLSVGDSSQEFSPIQEARQNRVGPPDEGACCSHSLPPMPLGPGMDLVGPDPWSTDICQDPQSREMPPAGLRAAGQGPLAHLMDPGPAFPGSPANSHAQRDARARADGGGAESRPVLRYSKEQRPTTLPIQPFVFQHHFPKQLAKARALHSLSQLYTLSGCSRAQQLAPVAATTAQAPAPAPSGEPLTSTLQITDRGARKAGPEPETSRPSPLGSYSPIRSAGPFGPSTDSSASTSCSPPPDQATTTQSPPPWSHTCPTARPATSQKPQKEDQKILTLAEYRLHGTGSLPPLGSWRSGLSRAESLARGGGEGSMATRPSNANHLSPQALKWREYRRKNPLGPPGLAGSLDRRPQEARLARRNPSFEFPGSLSAAGHLNGQVVKPLPLTCPDFQDPFSLTEKPPAEFCLSPDGNSEAISIDLLQKKGLVKAVNTAVDLIVAHFGTSRDPGVKAKLGNSSVSPNVGHLVLKYLCPAVRAVLEDGLKAFVLDVIIGQRRNMPWSVVEASTQLGPSTKVLHGLYNKVSQFPELTSHTMRFNAFILGLLNIRSLEFWFNHLYNHEDIIQTHYQPWGFLSAAHTVCPALFEELLLLLQPLALLPFSLDLLFQHRLLQSGQQQRQHKELLRVSQDLLLSAHSTLQLARARDQEGPGYMDRADHGERVKGVGAPEGGEEEEDEEDTEEAAEAVGGSGHGKWARSGQAGWWYQLMQSSQVYIDGTTEGSRFPRGGSNSSSGGSSSEKKKGSGGWGLPQAPPPREDVVEGAEACPAPEEAFGRDRGWPFWMGSPPDSVLAELRRSREREGPTAPPAANEEGTPESSPGVIRWGHLFGSRKAQREARPTNRLPSDWLSLDKSMFQLVAHTMGARREPEPKEILQEPLSPALPSKPPCEVQALCHHVATGPGQLSFHKGDILRVLGPAGGDWLRCSRGLDTGLVPLAYVTLTPTPSPVPGSSQN